MKLRLDAALKSMGVSRRQLADKMGVSTQHIAYLAAVQRCNFQTLARLAEVLDVPERELVEFER